MATVWMMIAPAAPWASDAAVLVVPAPILQSGLASKQIRVPIGIIVHDEQYFSALDLDL